MARAPSEAGRPRRRRWLRRAALVVAVGVVGAPLFDVATRIDPPALPPPAPQPLVYEGPTTRLGEAYLTHRGALWVMQTAGDPVGLGYQHARLASPLMAEGDARMLDLFATTIPSRTLRTIVSAIVQARYRRL